MPDLLLIGGPNGAGKSTVAPALIRELLGHAPFVNADVIARGLAGKDEAATAIRAGRLALEQIRALIDADTSFAFESTLSSRSLTRWLDEAKDRGYHLHVVYVWLPSPDESVRRVGRRVVSGGHSVPEHDVRRRWERSVANLRDLYLPRADSRFMYDNSGRDGPRLVANGTPSEVESVVDMNAWREIQEAMELREPAVAYGDRKTQTDRVSEAVRIGVGEALLKHKLLRQPVVAGDYDGNVWDIEPDDIRTGLTPEEEAEAIATAGHGTWFT